MKSVLQQLDALNQALQHVASSLSQPERTLAEEALVPLIHAAKRKCQNVLLHQAMISGINWGELGDIGRKPPLTTGGV